MKKSGFGMRYMLGFVNLFTVFPLATNGSYTMCAKPNSPGSRWMLVSTIQTSVSSSFSTGELVPL